MPSGLLGFNDLSATVNTSVYTVPSAITASFAVNFTNRGTSSTTVRLAVCSTSSPANSEYIIYDVILPAQSSLERTGLVAQADKVVIAYAGTSNVSVQVYGYEA